METTKYGAIYEAECCDVAKVFRERKELLWQELQDSIMGSSPTSWWIPFENRDETKRRVDFVGKMLKKYSNYFRTHRKMYTLVHTVNTQLARKEQELKEAESQIAMDFMNTEDKKVQLKAEISEMKEFKYLVKNSKLYFQEVHFSDQNFKKF